MLRKGGRYVVVGQLHSETVPIMPGEIVRKHARITGVRSASVEHYYRALEFIRHNGERFSWDDMISNRYPLSRINEAMQRMQAWQEIKPAIVYSH